ncbi:MAG: DUF2807 domain-containing protein [Gammaproteobacteria bacterium]|nr:DUF2807 domain-containing protein [Gammaproteobacteria bacterium]
MRIAPFALIPLIISGTALAADLTPTISATNQHLAIAVPAKVKISIGTPASLIISGSDADLALVEIKERDGQLSIGEKSEWFADIEGPLTIQVQLASLSQLSLAGATEVEIAPLTVSELLIEMAGDTRLTASRLDIETLNLDVAGDGEVTVKDGRCKTLNADVAGSGTFDTRALHCVDVTLDVAGAAEGDVYASGSLKVDVAGASEVRVHGSAKVEQSVVGSAHVTRVNP